MINHVISEKSLNEPNLRWTPAHVRVFGADKQFERQFLFRSSFLKVLGNYPFSECKMTVQ